MCRNALLVAVLTLTVLAACGQPPDREVSFTVDDHSARIGPIRDCDIQLTTCSENNSAVAVLTVPANQPVQISVPDSVAQTPWQVVFRYRKDSTDVGGRSEVFPPGARRGYTLHIPEAGTLERLEVQQYGAPELVNGEPNYRIRAAWVLDVRGP